MSILHGLRALVGCGKDSAIAEHFLADMRCFVSGIDYNGFYLWLLLRYLVKGHAVMNITRCYYSLQHKTILVAGGMRLIGKLSLVFPLYE